MQWWKRIKNKCKITPSWQSRRGAKGGGVTLTPMVLDVREVYWVGVEDGGGGGRWEAVLQEVGSMSTRGGRPSFFFF